MADSKINLLFIEDDHEACKLVRGLVAERPDFWVECCGTLAKGLDRLADGGVSCVLLDLGLPDSQGLNGIKQVLAQYPWMPVVVISGTDSVDMAESCVKIGAQDYVVKKHLSNRLTWAIRLALARHTAKLGNGATDKLDKTIKRLMERHKGVTGDLAGQRG